MSAINCSALLEPRLAQPNNDQCLLMVALAANISGLPSLHAYVFEACACPRPCEPHGPSLDWAALSPQTKHALKRIGCDLGLRICALCGRIFAVRGRPAGPGNQSGGSTEKLPLTQPFAANERDHSARGAHPVAVNGNRIYSRAEDVWQ
eukprot:4157483-Prymnesium_polylepis.1